MRGRRDDNPDDSSLQGNFQALVDFLLWQNDLELIFTITTIILLWQDDFELIFTITAIILLWQDTVILNWLSSFPPDPPRFLAPYGARLSAFGASYKLVTKKARSTPEMQRHP